MTQFHPRSWVVFYAANSVSVHRIICNARYPSGLRNETGTSHYMKYGDIYTSRDGYVQQLSSACVRRGRESDVLCRAYDSSTQQAVAESVNVENPLVAPVV